MDDSDKSEPSVADELNDGQWHKVAAILVYHFCGGDVAFGMEQINTLEGKAIVASHEQGGTVLRLRVLPDAEAQRMAEAYQQAARRKN